jgi:hypothetical protein
MCKVFLMYLHAKFRTPSYSGALVRAIRSKGKGKFRTSTMMLFYIL